MVEVCRGFTRWPINIGDSAVTLPVAEIPGFETSHPSACVLKDKRTPPVMSQCQYNVLFKKLQSEEALS